VTAVVWALFGLMATCLGALATVLYGAITQLGTRIDAARDHTDAQLVSMRGELRGEIGELRVDVSGQIGELRADMNSRFEVVHADIRELRTALRAS
jgi:hypothetical protein